MRLSKSNTVQQISLQNSNPHATNLKNGDAITVANNRLGAFENSQLNSGPNLTISNRGDSSPSPGATPLQKSTDSTMGITPNDLLKNEGSSEVAGNGVPAGQIENAWYQKTRKEENNTIEPSILYGYQSTASILQSLHPVNSIPSGGRQYATLPSRPIGLLQPTSKVPTLPKEKIVIEPILSNVKNGNLANLTSTGVRPNVSVISVTPIDQTTNVTPNSNPMDVSCHVSIQEVPQKESDLTRSQPSDPHLTTIDAPAASLIQSQVKGTPAANENPPDHHKENQAQNEDNVPPKDEWQTQNTKNFKGNSQNKKQQQAYIHKQQPNQSVPYVKADPAPASVELINHQSGMIPGALLVTANAAVKDFGAQNPDRVPTGVGVPHVLHECASAHMVDPRLDCQTPATTINKEPQYSEEPKHCEVTSSDEEDLAKDDDHFRRVMKVWEKPSQGYVNVNSDGSSLINPGRIGAGLIIRDHNSGFIHAMAAPLGEGTNNIAETEAAFLGIQWCLNNGFTMIHLESDSALLIQWLTQGLQLSSMINQLICFLGVVSTSWMFILLNTYQLTTNDQTGNSNNSKLHPKKAADTEAKTAEITTVNSSNLSVRSNQYSSIDPMPQQHTSFANRKGKLSEHTSSGKSTPKRCRTSQKWSCNWKGILAALIHLPNNRSISTKGCSQHKNLQPVPSTRKLSKLVLQHTRTWELRQFHNNASRKHKNLQAPEHKNLLQFQIHTCSPHKNLQVGSQQDSMIPSPLWSPNSPPEPTRTWKVRTFILTRLFNFAGTLGRFGQLLHFKLVVLASQMLILLKVHQSPQASQITPSQGYQITTPWLLIPFSNTLEKQPILSSQQAQYCRLVLSLDNRPQETQQSTVLWMQLHQQQHAICSTLKQQYTREPDSHGNNYSGKLYIIKPSREVKQADTHSLLTSPRSSNPSNQ
ncbi:hypothetical protein A4A49_15874 [Nicotiana attenuata]|uniref:RNase H type-1 domain-containing protein n=1 Tax=Nicotiana attenuata TaxID=49451 RepID=A0A1J6IV26_NICAT|nr:hypothetical protein A4A49_15874 [Nicotiana attenuata]